MTKPFQLSDLSAKLQAQVCAQIHGVKHINANVVTAEIGQKKSPKNSEVKFGKHRLRQNEKGPNKLELAFEEYLRDRNPGSPIHPQGATLLLANGCRYTPDFVMWKDGGVFAFETKGFMRDDASVKIKVAARVFPWIKFYLIWQASKRDGGGFNSQRILA